MNKANLFKVMEDSIKRPESFSPLSNCNATIYTVRVGGKVWRVLKSYSTVVACYSQSSGNCYVRDKYSNTTSKQVSRFINEFNAQKVIYLYNRKDKGIMANADGMVFKATSQKIADLMKSDWAEVIEDI